MLSYSLCIWCDDCWMMCYVMVHDECVNCYLIYMMNFDMNDIILKIEMNDIWCWLLIIFMMNMCVFIDECWLNVKYEWYFWFFFFFCFFFFFFFFFGFFFVDCDMELILQYVFFILWLLWILIDLWNLY